MAATIQGSKIVFNKSGDSLVLNCPIKRIISAGGSPGNVIIDGVAFGISSNSFGIEFESLNGYPGAVLSVGNITSSLNCVIAEIGDVLNPNYFKEDIRNWNGQGAAAVATAAETETPAPAKATRSKKAEVTE